MMSRSARSQLAKTTLEVMEVGSYVNPRGESVSIQADMEACHSGAEYFDPDQLDQVRIEVSETPRPFAKTRFCLANETTLEGASQLRSDDQSSKIGVLNFASAKNPGGGFLGGSQAQEESLARSSALYDSLNLFFDEYYAAHRNLGSAFYSDRMIFSPGCPVFRNDAGTFLEASYQVDILTSAAPNAGAIQNNDSNRMDEVPQILKTRMDKMLALFAAKGCETLVLGAWGCGVFRNCPEMVAESFAEYLNEGGPYFGRFRQIRFSVLDRSEKKPILNAFAQYFADAD